MRQNQIPEALTPQAKAQVDYVVDMLAEMPAPKTDDARYQTLAEQLGQVARMIQNNRPRS